MINKQIIKDAGLTENESEIYLILLNQGESTIYQIADHTKISRPNIYDIIKTLREKGLVSEIIKESKKHFQATSPEKLLDLLKTKQKNLLEIIPELINKYQNKIKKPIIEISQGAEGLKTIMNDMLKTKKEILIFNQIDERTALKYIPDFYLERYFNEIKKLNIKIKVLYAYNKKPKKRKGYRYKKLSKEQISNVGYWVYGDRVSVGIWTEEPLFIRIIDKEVAKTYRKSIELIWKRNP